MSNLLTIAPEKVRLAAQLATDVTAFEARGGHVQRLPPGATGDPFVRLNPGQRPPLTHPILPLGRHWRTTP